MILIQVAMALASIAAGPAPRLTGATQVVHYTFGPGSVEGLNHPAGWTRVIQPGYPLFVEAVVTRDRAVDGDGSLVFRLNGGHCAYYAPPAAASPDFNYVFSAQIKPEGLVHDRAFVVLEFLDERGRPTGPPHLSDPVAGTGDWRRVTIGPVAPPPSTRLLRVGCLSQHGISMDLTGAVYFDDLWIGRLPRFELTTSEPYQLFSIEQPKWVEARVTGIEDRHVVAQFSLADENEKRLAEETVRLIRGPDAWLARWDLPIREVGFYHLGVSLEEAGKEILRRRFPLTVMRPPAATVVGEFGLSFPPPRRGLAQVERLLLHSGSRWLKLPLWESSRDLPELAESSRAFPLFVERIHSRGHELVGMLDRPPASLLAHLSRPSVGVADVFTLPREAWGPEIEALMARHALKIHHWQLGMDRDTSFVGLPTIAELVRAIKREMNLIGRDTRLGLAWDWLTPLPTTAGIDFVAYVDVTASGLAPSAANGTTAPVAPSPMPAVPLERFLAAGNGPPAPSGAAPPAARERAGATERWIHLRPLDADRFTRADRIADLAHRVLAAKTGRADAIIATELEREDGFFDGQGAPLELFTVWSTLAKHLAGTSAEGSLYTKSMVPNHVFVRGEKATVAVWSDVPMSTELVVGERARIVDLWDRTLAEPTPGLTRTVVAGPVPILVVDGDARLLLLQLGTRLAKGRLTSEYGSQSDSITIVNPFAGGLSGRVTPRFPPAWRQRPEFLDLQMRPGDRLSTPLLFDIPQGVVQGETVVPIDFDVIADRPYRFRMLRPFRVGGDEISASTRTRALPDGRLEVELAITNLTDRPMQLLVKARTFERNVAQAVIDRLPPQETEIRVLHFDRAADILGRSINMELIENNGRRQFHLETKAEP